jgi:outer membrane lipoprotein-sorting protein
MELNKQVIGDTSGYSAAQGQKKDLTPEEFAEKKATATTFEELLLSKKADVTLDGIEPINGSDAYAIKNGKSTLYYDVKTGLKVMSSTTAERNGQKMTSTISYTDYKEVKGIKIPHNIVMSQGRDIEIKVTDVKINEGVTDADFQ